MEFCPPRRWAATVVGAALTAGLLALSLLLVWRLLREPPSFVTFAAASVAVLLLLLACLFAFWTFCCLTLTYTLDRNNLAIKWGLTKHVIPLSLIEALVPGGSVPMPTEIKGVNWPWYHVGETWLSEIGDVLLFSTHRSSVKLLYVVTPSLAYGVSIENQSEFTKEFELRRRLGPTEEEPLSARGSAVLSLAIWSDRNVQALLLAGLVINVFVFAYLYYVLPAQPNLTPVQITLTGAKEAMGWKWQALLPPALSSMALFVNLAVGAVVYAREKLAAYLSIGAGLLLQVIISVAVFKAVL